MSSSHKVTFCSPLCGSGDCRAACAHAPLGSIFLTRISRDRALKDTPPFACFQRAGFRQNEHFCPFWECGVITELVGAFPCERLATVGISDSYPAVNRGFQDLSFAVISLYLLFGYLQRVVLKGSGPLSFTRLTKLTWQLVRRPHSPAVFVEYT